MTGFEVRSFDPGRDLWQTYPINFFLIVFIFFSSSKISPMTGLEQRTSGIGSDRSTNWGTTTAQLILYFFS